MTAPLPPVVATFLANITDFKTKLGDAQTELTKTASLSKAKLAEIEAAVDKQVAELATAAKAAGTEFDATATKAELMATKTEEASVKTSGAFTKLAGVGKIATVAVGAAVALVAVKSIDAAKQYQTLTTQLVTGAGESEEAIKQVSNGILKLAPQVGSGPDALAKSMFTVESAGYHAADGLKVLQAASEGAKIGGADATVVANGLTTAMTDYAIPASQAADVTSKLVTTVASGKTTMQDLAGSLSNVLPTAAAAKVGLDQVLGALATMTGEGISADQASQNLANSIRSLQNPTQQQTQAMQALGLNSLTVAQNLGTKGLTGTMSDLVTAITAKMGPAGTVLLDTFKKSQTAAADATTELNAMPKSLQAIAKQFQAGTLTSSEWRADLKNLSVDQKQLAQQFATTVEGGQGFNDLLKQGGPAAQTFSATLSQVTGGATGMNTALALTGSNMATFQNNVKNIGAASTETGGHVKGWTATTKDLQFQIDQAKAGLDAMFITIGQKLIPIVSKAIAIGAEWINWLTKHKAVLIAVAAVVGGVLLTVIAAYIASMIAAAAATVAATWPILAVVAAVGLLVAAGIYVYKHWDTIWGDIKRVAEDAKNFIVGVFNDVWRFLQKWGPLILTAVAPFIGLPLLIYQHWGAVSGFFIKMWDDIRGVFSAALTWLEQAGKDVIQGLLNGVQAVWNLLWTWYVKIPEKILGVFVGAIGWLLNEGKDISTGLWNGIHNIWDREVSFFENIDTTIKGWFTGAAGWLINAGEAIIHGLVQGITNVGSEVGDAIKHAVGDIPGAGAVLGAFGVHLAEGGVVTKPTFALLGEGGEPEYVIPQSKLGTAGVNGVKSLSQALGQVAPATASNTGGGVTITNVFQITQPLGTPQAIAAAVKEAMASNGSINTVSYAPFKRN